MSNERTFGSSVFLVLGLLPAVVHFLVIFLFLSAPMLSCSPTQFLLFIQRNDGIMVEACSPSPGWKHALTPARHQETVTEKRLRVGLATPAVSKRAN